MCLYLFKACLILFKELITTSFKFQIAPFPFTEMTGQLIILPF